MTRKRLHVSGMHCVSCSLLIEGELSDIGVEATCNYAGGYVDVSWDEKKVKEKEIINTITKLGYVVTEKT